MVNMIDNKPIDFEIYYTTIVAGSTTNVDGQY